MSTQHTRPELTTGVQKLRAQFDRLAVNSQTGALHMRRFQESLTRDIEAEIERKVRSYRTWRAMGVCHADALESVLQNSTWGPALRAEVTRRIELEEKQT